MINSLCPVSRNVAAVESDDEWEVLAEGVMDPDVLAAELEALARRMEDEQVSLDIAHMSFTDLLMYDGPDEMFDLQHAALQERYVPMSEVLTPTERGRARGGAAAGQWSLTNLRASGLASLSGRSS